MAKPPLKIKPKPYRHKKEGWRIHFCLFGRKYARYVGRDQILAYLLQNQVNSIVSQIKCGFIAIPAGVSHGDFVFSQVLKKPEQEETPEPSPLISLSQLIVAYQEYSSQKSKKPLSTRQTEAIHLRHLQKFMEQRNCDPLLESIDVEFFEEFKEYRKLQGVSNITINKELLTMQVMFKMAVKPKQWVDSNIVKEVPRDEEEESPNRFKTTEQVLELLAQGHLSQKEIKDTKRFRYLNLEEIDRLTALAIQRWGEDYWLVPVLITFANTGLRHGELLRLRWIDIDFHRELLFAKSKKQSREKQEVSRAIDINPRLRKTLEKQKAKAKGEPWVFSGPNGGQLKGSTLRSAFLRLVKNTEWEGIGFHCFRHSLASNLYDQGVSLGTIAEILGHTEQAMTKYYTHLFPGRRKDAMNGLCARKENEGGDTME